MRLNSFYPVLLVDDVAEASRFFEEHLGFEARFRNDWYVSLGHAARPEYEIAFVLRTHESVPAGFRDAASRVLLNYEVEDVAALYERLGATELEILLPLRDEPWGQRHFIGLTPAGVLLDVIEPIPAAPEVAVHFSTWGCCPARRNRAFTSCPAVVATRRGP